MDLRQKMRMYKQNHKFNLWNVMITMIRAFHFIVMIVTTVLKLTLCCLVPLNVPQIRSFFFYWKENLRFLLAEYRQEVKYH